MPAQQTRARNSVNTPVQEDGNFSQYWKLGKTPTYLFWLTGTFFCWDHVLWASAAAAIEWRSVRVFRCEPSTARESPEMTRAQSCFLLKALSSRWASPLFETCVTGTKHDGRMDALSPLVWKRREEDGRAGAPAWTRGCSGFGRLSGSFWRCRWPSPACPPSASRSKQMIHRR